MVAQNTLKNSSTSRHKSNYDFCRQSKKSKINSQPSLSFSYKTCGCLTPLHQKRKWSQVKYSIGDQLGQLADILSRLSRKVTFERFRA